jgi:pimeloyl-[acyl-carrier protein] synthase
VPEGFDPTQFDPHAPAFIADPYPTYASFREHAPVHLVKPYGNYWLFGYEDCAKVLSDTEIWVKKGVAQHAHGPYGVMSSFPENLFQSDPPLHTELRQVLDPLIDEVIESAPQLARTIAEPLLAATRDQGRIELVADYALPLPARVLFTLLGIPNDGEHEGVWDGLIAWQAAIAAAHDITQPVPVQLTGANSLMALNSFFEGMLLEGRSSSTPPEGLFARMCEAFQNAGLSLPQIQVCACDLVIAGYLTTTFILATGVRNLLLNPEQLQKLREDPSLVHAALEEMLRFDGPVQLLDRCAATETEVAGYQFKPGDRVSTVIGSADRDGGRFSQPDSFDIERGERTHFGFGGGIHQCLGAPLVRKVAPVGLEMLLAEFSELVIDGTPQWQTDPYLRAPTSLPLRF